MEGSVMRVKYFPVLIWLDRHSRRLDQALIGACSDCGSDQANHEELDSARKNLVQEFKEEKLQWACEKGVVGIAHAIRKSLLSGDRIATHYSRKQSPILISWCL